jgi:lipid II:glycine glycyltransferase (peptidoglycan interpeptide bridge formation enzyme)
VEDIMMLHSLFPKQVRCVVGRLKNETLAGVVIFCTPKVVHTQYMGSTVLGREVGALTAIVERSVNRSKDCGARYFNFGISNDNEGMTLNEGLHWFKTSFGAGGVAHEFYELDLKQGLSAGTSDHLTL